MFPSPLHILPGRWHRFPQHRQEVPCGRPAIDGVGWEMFGGISVMRKIFKQILCL